MVLPADQEYYTDHLGVFRRTPRTIGPIGMSSPQGRALRAFVFTRDGFTCQECGIRPDVLPTSYDGVDAVTVRKVRRDKSAVACLVIDHVLSRMNGGTHHPSNLRTLCDPCNSAKAGREDARHPNAILGREQAERDRQAWLDQPRRRR